MYPEPGEQHFLILVLFIAKAHIKYEIPEATQLPAPSVSYFGGSPSSKMLGLSWKAHNPRLLKFEKSGAEFLI